MKIYVESTKSHTFSFTLLKFTLLKFTLLKFMNLLILSIRRRKLRVNVGKSKVMRCSRYGNGDRMHVILNGEPLQEVDCFK